VRTLLWPTFGPKLLSRLEAAGRGHEQLRIERVLAFSRLFLSLTCLAAWLIHSSTSEEGHRAGFALLLLYTACAFALLLWLASGKLGRTFTICAQLNDLVCPTLLYFLGSVSDRPFFVLFLFAVIAAAFRWGVLETLATTLYSIGVLVVQYFWANHHWLQARGEAAYEVDPARLVMRCIFLITVGVLLGVLAETQKQLQAEVALTNRLLSLTRVGGRFSTVLQDVLAEIGRVFEGTAVFEVVAQNSTGRAFRWELPSMETSRIHATEIEPAQKSHDLMAGYPHTFYIHRNGGSRPSVTALDDEGRVLETVQTHDLSMPIPNAQSVLVVSHEMGRDWTGRLVLVNPQISRDRLAVLHFAQDVMRQLAPALYSVYLVWDSRNRAGASERARVARELHDTTIQSLISIEMQLDVLRRGNNDAQISGELERIQGLLRQEVLNLRDLMRNLRPVDIKSHQVLDFIADLVERFSRDTGITVRFISDLQEVDLSPATCRELVRIVQEGLVNIRKHSKAQSAVVHLGAQDGLWKLVINDDGNGFPFAGRVNLAEMDSLHRGPAVIKERVRAIGGDLVVESTPGHGSRLEVTIPQKGSESYG
jgi:signal transduction histidine kinase